MLILPGILSGIRSRKDKTLAITFETKELTPEQSSGVINNLNDFGYIAFKKEQFNNDEKQLIDSIKADQLEINEKTPAQRLRAVLYRLWEQDKKSYDTFTDFYKASMEKLITHFKDKLE